MPCDGKHKRGMWAFPLVVCVSGILGILAGLQAVPPGDIPAYALDSAVVYKSEVGVVFFLAVYLVATAIALAFEGRTVGKITASGIELPSDLATPVMSQREIVDELEKVQRDIAQGDDVLSRHVDRLWGEIERLRTGSGGKRR